MARSLCLLASAAALLGALSGAACDVFAQVRCDDDSACPSDVPFCVEGVCAASEGEGEGEGEGERCVVDDPCGGGLCCADDTACAGHEDTCVGDAPASCAAASAAAPRAGGGPAIFDVTATATGPCSPDGAGVRVELRYLDLESDMWRVEDGHPALFVTTAGFPDFPVVFQAGQVVNQDGDSFAGTFAVFGCVSALDDALAVWIEDTGDRTSNVVCVEP